MEQFEKEPRDNFFALEGEGRLVVGLGVFGVEYEEELAKQEKLAEVLGGNDLFKRLCEAGDTFAVSLSSFEGRGKAIMMNEFWTLEQELKDLEESMADDPYLEYEEKCCEFWDKLMEKILEKPGLGSEVEAALRAEEEYNDSNWINEILVREGIMTREELLEAQKEPEEEYGEPDYFHLVVINGKIYPFGLRPLATPGKGKEPICRSCKWKISCLMNRGPDTTIFTAFDLDRFENFTCFSPINPVSCNMEDMKRVLAERGVTIEKVDALPYYRGEVWYEPCDDAPF